MQERRAAIYATAAMFMSIASVHAAIDDDQVLVVYNSASSDAETLKNAYIAAHPAIPTANVFDINSSGMLVADVTVQQFVSGIRNPIRDYLLTSGDPDPEDIIAIVLIRPFPHRLLDINDPFAGDVPNSAVAEINAGDATFASVDMELVLLWQELYATEGGGVMDSLSDNVIDNPYHTSSMSIQSFPRTNITVARSIRVFENLGGAAWGLDGFGGPEFTPGDMYLVCRIDGNALADATAMIDRAQMLQVNRAAVRCLLDEYDLSVGDDLDDDPLFGGSDPFLAGDDYEETRDRLTLAGWDVRYDDTFDFVSSSEEVTPLIAYASYGENHDIAGAGENPLGSGTYIDGYTFAPGAIFNTFESFNGRDLNGLGTMFGQEQVADFIAAGGTFGIGNVFEPFTFSGADNEFLFGNMLVTRMTWAEAAYSSIPTLSWQHVVLGDPLARYEFVFDLRGDCDADGGVDDDDVDAFVDCVTGPVAAFANGCTCVDFDASGTVDLLDFAEFVFVEGCQAAPLMFTQQPQPQMVCESDPAMFSITVAQPVDSYQWKKDGVPLPGETSPTLTISSAAPADEGSYTCQVSDGCVTGESASAPLALLDPPSITSQPNASITACSGGSASFSVTAAGTGPFTYQWSRNDVEIPGATSSVLALNNLDAGDEGAYSCLVTGLCGMVESNDGVLELADPEFTEHPQSQCAEIGETAIFTATAQADTAFSIFWEKDGEFVTGASGDTLTISNVQPSDAGNYVAVAFLSQAPFCVVDSAPAVLTVGGCSR